MDGYDVFLNQRGPDVKAGLMSHLEEALRQAGLNPFLDKSSLKQGNDTLRGMDAALGVARVHVAVVSKRYAESKHCLSELVAMLGSGRPVIPVLYDVEPCELRRVDKGAFAAAFRKHRWREAAERVQEWADALCKQADITAFVFRSSDYQGNEAELNQKVVNAVLSSLPSHDILRVESHLVGLEEHMKTCLNELKKMSGAVGVLGLVGMGGIGKTSLAKVLYNHLIAWKKFQGMSFLEIGRHSPSSMEIESSLLKRMQKQLLWDLLHIPESNQARSYGSWFPKLSRRGPVLIVLDDIQDKDQFDNLIPSIHVLGSGSCIIVTSPDHHLLKLVARRSRYYCIRGHECSLNSLEELLEDFFLPDSSGALTSLQELWIGECTSLIELPRSIGHLLGLREFGIQGCDTLQSLPDSLRYLNSLVRLQIMDCGRSLEGLGLLRALQGLRIWGCTSISELPGSCLVVVDSSFESPAWIWVVEDLLWVRRKVKEVQVVEADDCGFLRNVRDAESARVFLQRVNDVACCGTLNPVRKNERLGSQRLLCPSAALIEEIL